ncbi:MAG: peptidase domain-containing ABC transporter [Bacteroidales bacterium]|nr:peptidase domain-containing ABC transporter [Bacteroidales bacterium]
MKKSIRIKQHDMTDCGAACLASVAASYRLHIPVSRIRQLASTDQRGTNILGLVEAAEKMGFSAKGVKGIPDSLSKIPLPAILHLVVKDVLHHFVVLYKVTKKHMLIMDPATGNLERKTHQEILDGWTGVLVLLVPEQDFKTERQTDSLLRRFFKLLSPHRPVLVQALFGAAFYSILGLSTSLYLRFIIDHVLISGNLNLLRLLSFGMIILLCFRVYINMIRSFYALKTGQQIDASLILGYYRHLLTLPQRFFDTMRVGEIISRVNDAMKIRALINNVSLELIVNALIIVFTLGIMLIFSWKLAMMVMLSLPLYGLVYFLFNRLNRRYLRKIMEHAADLESQLVESVTGIATIRQSGSEAYTALQSENRFLRLLGSSYRSARGSILSTNAAEFIAGGLTIGVLWFGSWLVIGQELSPGKLLSFYALLGYLISPVGMLIRANQSIQDALIAADRLFQIMDLETEEAEGPKIELTAGRIGDIHFRNVSFRYGTRAMVFRDLDLVIRQGRTTAFVGESGSGKTSLTAMIQKLYPIQSGSIEIGSYNLEHISNFSLRRLIGVVPQKIELFAGTITKNIAFGCFEPDMKRIIDVCDFLNIRSFIEQLPGGFNAWLGEQGVSLSGGEKQRIAIARALYHDPEILILDEATSALDSASEESIHQALSALRQQNKTIILIAHRLSTVMHADQIYVLHNGEVVESGTHSELLTRESRYYNLWAKQIPVVAGSLRVH